MIQYKSLIQYSRIVDGLIFPQNRDNPFLLLYFSENSLFIDDYPKLNLRKVDAKHVVVPLTKIPVSRITPDQRNSYKQYGLLPYGSNMNFPKNKNLIYDLTYYLDKVDSIYKPNTYRQRAGFLIQNLLFKSFSSFSDNYRKILMYSIDITKPTNSFINRKVFPLMKRLKSGDLFFDDLLLVLVGEGGARYRLLVSEKDYKFSRVLQYLKKVKLINTEEEEEDELKSSTNKVFAKVGPKVVNKSAVKAAVTSYLKKDKSAADKVANNELTDKEMDRLTVASILYRTSGDLDKAQRLSKSIPQKNIGKAVTNVSKQYKDDLLEPEPTVDLSNSVITQQSNVPSRIDHKSPGHIFDKRRIDFETNLRKDMTNAFKVLEHRDIPLKFDSITIKDKPQRAGEIYKTDEAVINIKLKDKFGKTHSVNMDIPKIDPDTGTFRVSGQRKCMINQIVLNPISFPKEYDSKFESSYSSFHIYSKRTKRLKYLEAYMGSFRLPLLLLLSYSFGFNETLKQYGISYKIVDEKPSKEKYFLPVPSSYLIFEKVDTELKEEMVSSLINAKINVYEIDKKFLTKDYFNDLIIKITGRVDSTYLITNNLENIVDPIVKQILINQQLPFSLPQIFQYMSTKVISRFVQERNDITNQRIRNSEVLVHLAQKQLLRSYTEYREQYLAGNKDAKLNVPETKVSTEFINLEIVQSMEYANPSEEMATITKVSPVGKTVGGIPDKQAVQLDARNVHKSYFGNIDPLDTSESDNIGITQQLTVDAYITSARGLFGIKEINNKERSGILSTTTAMIPFVENNEGARIIMAANQAKQMLPLKNPEPPIVQSGYESILTDVLSDSFIKRAPCDGKVAVITDDYIGIVCKAGKKEKVSIVPMQLKSGSGKNTLSTFVPTVEAGKSVKKKQVIAEGSCISNGTISLGRNLLAAYMPYKGFNFEDGIAINERLVTNNKLTSLHGVDVVASVERKDKVLFITEIGKDTVKGEPLFRKFPGEVGELLDFQEEDETTDMYDGQIITKSPGGKIVDIEVFSNLDPNIFSTLKPFIERTNKKYKKPAKEKFTEKNVSIKGIKIVFKIEQELQIGLGDKLCNRFGNKGIISLIEEDSLMPRTPWGETLDIVFSPLGVLSRMNMGQIYELYCGLISKELAKRIIAAKSKTEVIKSFQVLKGLDTSPNQKYSTSFINNIKKLTNAQFKKLGDQLKSSGFVPIIVPPFQSPTHKDILSVLKTMDLKTGYHLKLPEFNTKTKSAVPVGYLYISKLEHIGEMKVQSRSTGPTVGKTLQPTAGKQREGGQKMGEGDTWALASYNCPIMLSEFFGPLSDDVVTKNEMITEIVQTGDTDFKPTKSSPTKDLLNAYFIGLMLGG